MYTVLSVGDKREKRSIDPQHHDAYNLLVYSCKEWAILSVGPRVQEAGGKSILPRFPVLEASTLENPMDNGAW